MIKKRRTANPKHRFATALIKADLERLAGEVKYTGNAEHKRTPGDFGLTPDDAYSTTNSNAGYAVNLN